MGAGSIARAWTAEFAGDQLVTDRRRRRTILAAMCIALVAVIASVSGLNVAQQAMAADLGASQSQLLWVINGYTVALAALLMPVGAIGDRWGRRPVLLIGLAWFAATNMAAGFAGSVEVLIVLRVAAGVAAAMIMPVTLSVITTSFPREDKARAIGIWAGFAGAGGILGLFASAAVIDYATWPWVFALPVGLVSISFWLTLRHVPPTREASDHRFDVAGSILSALAVGGLVLALHEGPEQGWTAPVSLGAVTVGLAATLAFVVVELRVDHPLLDVRVFRSRALAVGSVNLMVVFAVMFSLFLVLILYMQAVFGYSALRAACGLLPMAVAMLPLSTVAPVLAERVGLRQVMVSGMVMIAGGLALFAFQASVDGGYLSVLPGALVIGIGAGLAMSPSTAAITSALPHEEQGVASALNDTVRELGGAIGIAFVGSILNAGYRREVSASLDGLPAPVAQVIEDGIGGAAAIAPTLGPDGAAVLGAARQAFVDGLVPSAMVAAAMAVGAALFTLVRAPGRGDGLGGAESGMT